MKKSYCIIHGHFYQPPRENAWTEMIELQPSAAPFHDWNEKINHECYRPNVMARILDPKGRVLEIVNNFRLISFDAGPTLMNWLERHSPRTYHHITQADRESVREHGGHGNAMAQVFNHMIMPLATERDKLTQVRWGIQDFRHRFGRDPEGMWLPETAANDATLRVLIQEKIKFTILAPHQAEKIRRIGSADWQDVSQGTIDTTRPYRYFVEGHPEMFIDLFFYDGAIAHDVSFGELAWDARRMAARLEAARDPGRQHPELIHVATDGETYGHHKAYGDRVLAYLTKYEAQARGFIVTNYAAYLDKFPPQYEVRLKAGAGEGTSWSCVHGVGRWKENCGCQAGAQFGWNQNWRGPLRQSFDFIRDRLYTLYERQAVKFFKDPWLARDEYIQLVLDRSDKTRWHFFEKHAASHLSEEDVVRALKLLEMQRFAMLMYTSCGWFFSELSGIETIQVIQYGARAVEFAQELGDSALEREWLAKLALAKSNIPSLADGRGVFEKFVRPSRMKLERLIFHQVLQNYLETEEPRSEKAHGELFWTFRFEPGRQWQGAQGNLKLCVGELRFESKAIPESQSFLYAILRARFYEFLVAVKRHTNAEEFPTAKKELTEALEKANEIHVIHKMDQILGGEMFTLKDLVLDVRRGVSIKLSGEMLKRFYDGYQKLYEENQEALEIFEEAGIPFPEEYRLAAEIVLNHRLTEAVKQIDWNAPRPDYRAALDAVEEAQRWGFKIQSNFASELLSGILNEKVEKLAAQHGVKELMAIEHIVKAGSKLGLELHDRIAQDVFFLFLQEHLPQTFNTYQIRKDASLLAEIRAMLHLGRRLGFNLDRFFKKIREKV